MASLPQRAEAPDRPRHAGKPTKVIGLQEGSYETNSCPHAYSGPMEEGSSRARVKGERSEPERGAVMGLAIAMALFLLAVAVAAALVVGAGWGVAHLTHGAFAAARGALRRGRS